jgi:AraC-like DNA-binding protein
VQEELKKLHAHPFLYLENVIIHFKHDRYVLEKEGTSDAERMFTRYYASEAYQLEDWVRLFDESFQFKILPAADFTEMSARFVNPKGRLLPVVVKLFPYEDLYFIAMLDADKLFNTYHYTSEAAFYILDANGRPVYASSSDASIALPAAPRTKSTVRRGDYYYFYQEGNQTGFTYVTIAATKNISAQLLQLNLVLITLLIAAVVISVMTSVGFSVRLNTPIQRILEIAQRREPGLAAYKSRIYELDLITDRMSRIILANRTIEAELNKKKSILKQYAYLNRLKNIYTSFIDANELQDLPFVLALYKITMKERFAELELEVDRAVYIIRELIDARLQLEYANALTIQIERNLVLSLIFGDQAEETIRRSLEHILRMLDHDRDYVLLTVAVSSRYASEADFAAAYAEASKLLDRKKLTDASQLITGPAPPRRPVSLSPLELEEFQTKLMSGHADAVVGWIGKVMGAFARKGAVAEDYRRLAEDVVAELNKAWKKWHLSEELGDTPLGEIEDFYLEEQYEDWLIRLTRPTIDAVMRRSSEQDPMIRFILEYAERHLNEDVNLDAMADKLNLTPGYLSTVFKEKTGMNFSDYLNDLRVRRAKLLLQRVNVKIQDVAAAVGYQNVNSFIRMFKRYSGMTPGEYRRRFTFPSEQTEAHP